MSDLGPIERGRLGELEAVIERGLQTFIEVGQALLEVRDARLYRATHGTFEDYCRERWDMRRESADRLVRAAEVVAGINPMGLSTPSSERVARELAPLRDQPGVMREAWTEAVERHGSKPTAKQVREITKERMVQRRDEHRQQRRRKFGWLEVDRHVDVIERNARDLLDLLRDAELDDDQRAAAIETLVRVRGHLDLIEMAITGRADVDWDTELRGLTDEQ
jgi:hypothetical protein